MRLNSTPQASREEKRSLRAESIQFVALHKFLALRKSFLFSMFELAIILQLRGLSSLRGIALAFARKMGRVTTLRRAIYLVPLVLVLAGFVAPNAKADSITFFGGFTTPTDPSISISGTDAISLGSVSDIGFTFVFSSTLQASATPYSDTYSWSLVDIGIGSFESFTVTDVTTGSSVTSYLGDFAYEFGFDGGNASVSGASVAAPEPGTLALLPLGLVALFLMRKRIARGLPQAA
jgi:hypothetical protein